MTNQKKLQALKDVQFCVSSETGKSEEQPKFPYPTPGQHSRISLDDAITQYKAKVLTSAGLVYHAVKIYRASGCRLRVQDVNAFCELLTINRSTFYKAINKLEQSDLDFHWEPVDGIYLWIGDSQSPNGDSQSPNGDSQSPNGDSQSPNGDFQSPNGDFQSPNGDFQSPNGDFQSPNGDFQSLKPLLGKPSSVSSNIIQIHTTTNISLSDLKLEERENFERFVKEEWKRTKGEEVDSLNAVLRGEFFKEWYEKYQNRPEALKAAQNAKWENHPHREEWIAEIEKSGNPLMFAGGDKQKQEFVKWANENKIFSWHQEDRND